MGLLKKIGDFIRLMSSPAELREHNINALMDKETLTDAEWQMLDDMKHGGVGRGSSAMKDSDYVDRWQAR